MRPRVVGSFENISERKKLFHFEWNKSKDFQHFKDMWQNLSDTFERP